MNRSGMAVGIYARATLVSTLVISICMIPEAGLAFPMFFFGGILIAIPFSVPVCVMLWFSFKPIFSMNYSFTTCLVFFGFANAVAGALVINGICFLLGGIGSTNELLMMVNGCCLAMAVSGTYLSKNTLNRYYKERQLLLLSKTAELSATPAINDIADQGRGKGINAVNESNGSEFDPYKISLN